MYLETLQDTECCGCSACEQICPQKCIFMKRNKEGFLYPEVNKKLCINCHLCKKVCPISNHKNSKQKDICYYGWHRNEEIRMMSTSGAAFIAIAEVCKNNSFDYFYGAAYDNKFVHHIGINRNEDISLLRNSKYTQSELGNVYSEIATHLEQGKTILFSGTPCQVDGLLRFINPKYRKKLLTVALVCHGVTSPKAFEKYLLEMEVKHSAKIQAIKFRDKIVENNVLSHRYTTIQFENGEILSDKEDIYTNAFGIGIMDRMSCYFCPYASPNGAGDITIGDFWGIEKYIPELEYEISKGISLLIPHTDQGENLVKELHKNMEIVKVPIKYALNDKQRQLLGPIELPPGRDKFLENILVYNKPFLSEAKKVIYNYKIDIYKKRFIKKVKHIFKG